MGMDTLVPGQRLVTRGQPWTLLDAERGADCVALRLAGEIDSANRTLLFPFDRFVPCPYLHLPRFVKIRRWLHVVRRLGAGTRSAGTVTAAARARIRLLPYQLEPALAVVRHGATRLLIADAVGLGKTVQAGLIVANEIERTPSSRVLVIVPAGLREQWCAELERLFGLPATPADAAWLRAATRDRPCGTNPWTLPGIYVSSCDFLKQAEVLRPIEEVLWDVVVVDEAHAASFGSDRRIAVNAIARRARVVVLLTATPHLDNAREHQALCAIGDLDHDAGPLWVFRRSKESLWGGRPRRSTLLAVGPSVAEARMHELLDEYTRRIWRESGERGDEQGRLAAIVLRKRALSSAGSLAASVRRRMQLLVSPAESAETQQRLPLFDEDPLEDETPASVLGVPGLGDAVREKRWLALVAEAAQHAAGDESKSRFLRRLLERITEPAIIFTEYRDTLLRLREALWGINRRLLLLHGGMTSTERARVQQEFNDSPAVLLATDAASEGLNLHRRCRLVIHYELPWSLSRLEQRVGRVDRFGQGRRVHEIALVAAATAERFVLGPLLRRAREAASRQGMSELAAALTESRIAAIVLANDPVSRNRLESHVAPMSPASPSERLSQEARDEAARLSEIRGWLERSSERGRGRHPHRPVAAAIERRLTGASTRLVLVYVLTMRSRSRIVHEQTVVLSVAASDRAHVSAQDTCNLVEPFSSARHPAAREALEQVVRRALDEVVPMVRRVAASRGQRERLIRDEQASAARLLVQGGLFDRRLARAAPTSAPDANRWCGSDHLDDPGILCVETRLAAALWIAGR